MRINRSDDSVMIFIDKDEYVYVLSEHNRVRFVQVTSDEYDDLVVTKRHNLKFMGKH